MATVITLTTGTTWNVPSDFDPDNNIVECWGGGASGRAAPISAKSQTKGRSGGGSGAYSRGDNIQLVPGSTIDIAIGAGGSASGGGDTYFNATSAANAASNGGNLSVAAKGGATAGSGNNEPGAGGVAADGTGNHTKTSGGTGEADNSNTRGGAGGDCPNGGSGGARRTSTGSNPGSIPGGAGSGGYINYSTSGQSGGLGARGEIKITYEPKKGGYRMFMVFN